MPISSDKQEALKQVTIEYLSRLRLLAIYHHDRAKIYVQEHCSEKLFTSPKKHGLFHLIGPIKAWERYLTVVGSLTDERVNHETVKMCIDKALKVFTAFSIEPNQREEIADQFMNWFNNCYDRRTISYVLISNMVISYDVEPLQFANGVLHRGFPESELANHIKELPIPFPSEIPEQTCFLKFDTFGDDEGIERQIGENVQQSLQVLRFCSNMGSTVKGTQRVSYNEARYVGYFPCHTPRGYYLFTQVDGYPFHRYLIKRPDPFRVDAERVEDFNLMGRELLNRHFANIGNPISDHILLALEWYDSGLQAPTNRDAVYRFLVCLNVILGWDYSQDNLDSNLLASRLKKLFVEYASHENDTFNLNLYGRFEGLKDLSNWKAKGKSPENIIEKVMATYADLFKILFLEQRNSILHGKPHKLGKPILFHDVSNSQLLAQNGLRLIMQLIFDHPTWQNLQDVEDWFKQSSQQTI